MTSTFMDGMLVIDKPAGPTSHDIVGQVRHILRERRVGHAGTLDPFATGVLVVLVGRATRLAQFLTAEEKEYEAVIRLGYETSTGDLTGTPVPQKHKCEATWTDREIELALQSLRGETSQVPPMYSAKKRAGRKLYELARQGKQVERKPVRVCIHEFEALKPTGELFKNNQDGTFDLRVRVVCSAGTYIRALAEDFGKCLGVGAHLAELRRTRAGDIRVETALSLELLKQSVAEEALGRILLSPDEALSRLPFVHLSDQDARRTRHGLAIVAVGTAWRDGEKVRMRDGEGNLIAVGYFDETNGLLQPRVVVSPEK